MSRNTLPVGLLPEPEPNILVVDDDPVFTSVAQACLARSGFDVVITNDAIEALRILDRESFMMAIIDLTMPRVDGYRLIPMIRSMPRGFELPVVVVSSRTDLEAVEQAYELGIDGYITKPVNWALLPPQIRHIVRTSRTVHSLRNEIAALRRAAPRVLTMAEQA